MNPLDWAMFHVFVGRKSPLAGSRLDDTGPPKAWKIDWKDQLEDLRRKISLHRENSPDRPLFCVLHGCKDRDLFLKHLKTDFWEKRIETGESGKKEEPKLLRIAFARISGPYDSFRDSFMELLSEKCGKTPGASNQDTCLNGIGAITKNRPCIAVVDIETAHWRKSGERIIECYDRFWKRCIYHDIEFPEKDKMEWMMEIVENRLRDIPTAAGETKSLGQDLLEKAVDIFYCLRDKNRGLSKKPSTAELITFVRRLREDANGADPFQADRESLSQAALNTLVKKAEDKKIAKSFIEKEWQPGTKS